MVDGDKPVMGYLYEAMEKAKEAIRAYYEDKGDEGLKKQQVVWRVIDERWNYTLHRHIHATGIYLNVVFSYSYGFRFDDEVMDGFLTCVESKVKLEWEQKRGVGAGATFSEAPGSGANRGVNFYIIDFFYAYMSTKACRMMN